MDNTKIEWTDATWNPIRGCSKVSPGCTNCYAERVAARFSGPGMPYEGVITNGKWNGKVKVVNDVLDQPLRWKRSRRIFVNSMSDLFHENVTDGQRCSIFGMMAMAHQHTFQVLTKRPEAMRDFILESSGVIRDMAASDRTWRYYPPAITANKNLPDVRDMIERFRWPLPNVWLGVSVENQKTADERIPLLLQTPAEVRFISIEPLLGPITIMRKMTHPWGAQGASAWWTAMIDWIIVGGESGQQARPLHPEWARLLRAESKAANIPFFFKQWGEWLPLCQEKNTDCVPQLANESPRVHLWPGGLFPGNAQHGDCVRVGKQRAGRELDGRTWDEYPRQS